MPCYHFVRSLYKSCIEQPNQSVIYFCNIIVGENSYGLIILCARRYMEYQKAVMFCDQKTQLYFMELILRTLFFYIYEANCVQSQATYS